MKILIVTADDFGRSIPVNEAVEVAYTEGILSAASLMTGAPAFDDAVERARRLPRLGVGLHIALVDGDPVLPRERVPLLVDREGRFFKSPERFGLKLFFSREMRRQAEAEVQTQFDRFAETGVVMDHVNGHHHFHMHPVVAGIVAKIAPKYGSPPVRNPVEPFWPSWRASGNRMSQRLTTWAINSTLSYAMRRKFKSANTRFSDRVFGLNDSGRMIESRILALLDHLPDGVTELYCHPAARPCLGAEGFSESYLAFEEFQALVSRPVRAKLAAMALTPLSFKAALA